MAVEPVEESGSLSDHEAQFHESRQSPRSSPSVPVVATEPDADPETPVVDTTEKEAAQAALEEAADPNSRYRPKEKHRARSQQARPEDVPRIKELTRKLKEAEEALVEARKPKPVEPVPVPVAARQQPIGTAFTEKEPTLEQFADKPDPYLALVRATAAYDRRKEAWDDQQQRAKDDEAATTRRQQEATQAQISSYSAKRIAFAQAHPDFDSVVQQGIGTQPDPPLLLATVLAHDKGPELVYALAKQPALYHEMRLIADGKPVTDAHVASLRRILDARVQVGTTGATVPQEPVRRQPRPPTPVRTGPIQTGTEPPGDGASLADHEAYYTRRRR